MRRQCPNCKSFNVRRSSRESIDSDQPFFRSPYRCRDCHAKFWALSTAHRNIVVMFGLNVVFLALLAWFLLLAAQKAERESAAEAIAVTTPRLDTSSSQDSNPPQQAPGGAQPSNWTCDCSKQTGSCAAEVIFKDGVLNIGVANAPKCSRVVFSMNGELHATTVVNGVSSEQWLGGKVTRLGVSTCTVCAESYN